jgi:hypothetical protein
MVILYTIHAIFPIILFFFTSSLLSNLNIINYRIYYYVASCVLQSLNPVIIELHLTNMYPRNHAYFVLVSISFFFQNISN